MRPISLTVCLLTLLALPPAATARAADFSPLARWIDKTKHETGQSSGTAVAVIADGEVVYEGYFGHADIGGRQAVDRNTAFYIASATKPFVALSALQQAETGRLLSRTTVAAMFPEVDFPFDATTIDLSDLLSHQSGIDNAPLVWSTAFTGLHDETIRRGMVALSRRNTDVADGPFRYGNVGYNIASVWMEAEIGEPWQVQLQRTVLDPLGMRRTTAFVSKAVDEGWPLALPYSITSVDRSQPLYLRKVDETMQAAGGMLSTAPDLARFLIAQMSAAGDGSHGAIPAAVIRRSQRPLVAVQGVDYEDFERRSYAWGWYEGPYKGERMLHHFGGFAGFHAHLSFMPERRRGLVILHNEDSLSPRLSSLIADYVYGTLAGEQDVESRVGRRFEDLWPWVRRMDEGLASQRRALEERPWQLSLPRQAYVGRYRHELSGAVEVRLTADGELAFEWGRLQGIATAYPEPDHVRLEWIPNSGQPLRFDVAEGRVRGLEVAGMRFERAGD